MTTGPTSSPPPAWPYPYPPPPPRGRPLSFWVAWVLLLLLAASLLLNLALLALAAGQAISAELAGGYQEQTIGGDRDARRKILQIDLHGVLSEEATSLLGMRDPGVVTRVRQQLATAAEDAEVAGVLLHVDSPGGGVTDSDVLHELVQDFRRRSSKPVVAYLHSLAASGGYYVAVAADHIIAHPTCVTGSIGVILGSWNYAEALQKIGVKEVTIKSESTPYKDILSGSREMRDEERAILQGVVEEMYQRFLEVVDAGRAGLDREQVRQLADGRIYSGAQAHRLGLVDALGSRDDAVQWLQRKAGVSAARLVKLVRPQPSLLDLLLHGGSADSSLARLLPFTLSDQARRPMFLFQGR